MFNFLRSCLSFCALFGAIPYAIMLIIDLHIPLGWIFNKGGSSLFTSCPRRQELQFWILEVWSCRKYDALVNLLDAKTINYQALFVTEEHSGCFGFHRSGLEMWFSVNECSFVPRKVCFFFKSFFIHFKNLSFNFKIFQHFNSRSLSACIDLILAKGCRSQSP